MSEIKEFIQNYKTNPTVTIIVCSVVLAIWVVAVIARWKIFQKMNEKGWKSLIPFYGDYILFARCWDKSHAKKLIVFAVLELVFFAFMEIFGRFDNLPCNILFLVFAILELVAVIYNAYLMIRICFRQAKSFGRIVGFGFGLLFLPYIFNFILGFGNAKYVGADAAKNNDK